MEPNKNYKRKTREMPQEVKDKISNSLRGRKKSFQHSLAISKGQKRAWEQIKKNNE